MPPLLDGGWGRSAVPTALCYLLFLPKSPNEPLRAREQRPRRRCKLTAFSCVSAATNQCLHAADASINLGTVALVGINRVRGQRNPGDWKIGMRSPDLGASTRKRLLWCVVRCTC